MQPQQPKTRVNLQPKLTMKTMATLYSPKIREKSDPQSWTKEGHKRIPQSDEGNDENLTQSTTGAEAELPA